MAQAIFIVALEGIKINEDLGRGDRFFDDLYITNSKNLVKDLLKHETIRSMLGDLEISHLIKSDVVIYGKFDLTAEENNQKYLVDLMYKVLAFLNTSWFFSDNSINQDNAYLIVEEQGKPEHFHTNHIHLNFVPTTGVRTTVELSREELKTIREFTMELYDKEDIVETRSVRNKLFSHKSRVARAIYLSQHARSERTPEIRLSLLVNALEALFVDASSEVSHILSERVAIFFEQDVDARIATYNTIKKCYNYRSKVFHGDTVKERHFDEVNTYVVELEEIVKKILLKILTNEELVNKFHMDNEQFGEYMKLQTLS